MFLILHRAEKKLFNVRMEMCQPTLSFSVWEVNVHISSRRDDVKLWIKDIDTVNHTVKSWEGEGSVTLILSNFVLAVEAYREIQEL